MIWLFLIGYFVVVLYIGIRSQKNATKETFLISDRNRSGFATGASIALGIRIEELPLEASRPVSRTWIALIKKVYEVDPLVCPKCGEKMKVRELLKYPPEIEKVAAHFNIPTFAQPTPLQDPTELFPIEAA